MESSVFFRAFEPEDVILIHKWRNDQEMMKDAVGMPRPTSIAEDRAWVEGRMKHDPYNYYFAICLNDESKRMIGYLSINSIHYINSSAETGAVVIGEKEYRDGISWIESILYMLYFAFEVLHLNRLYGCRLVTQKISSLVVELFGWTEEGISRKAAYKNGEYVDVCNESILREEYYMHKERGDYELRSIIKKLRQIKNNK